MATQLDDGRIFVAYYYMVDDGNNFGGSRFIAGTFLPPHLNMRIANAEIRRKAAESWSPEANGLGGPHGGRRGSIHDPAVAR